MLRHFRVANVAVEKLEVLHILSVGCSLKYRACMGTRHIVSLWPAPLYKLFPHYLINGTIYGKKVTEHKTCVLIFSTAFV